MLLLGSRNALGRAKCHKTGEKSIFGPLPGGPPGPPATLRRRVGRPLSEGGPGPELSGIIQGSRIQNVLPVFSSFSSSSFSSSSSKRDRLGCFSQKTFWSKSKATPPTLFSNFLNLETLTSIKSVKNSFSVKSGGLRNYKLLIRKPC